MVSVVLICISLMAGDVEDFPTCFLAICISSSGKYLLKLSQIVLCIQNYQASQSMGFSRQEYWSGVPFPSPGDLPDPEIEPGSPTL